MLVDAVDQSPHLIYQNEKKHVNCNHQFNNWNYRKHIMSKRITLFFGFSNGLWNGSPYRLLIMSLFVLFDLYTHLYICVCLLRSKPFNFRNNTQIVEYGQNLQRSLLPNCKGGAFTCDELRKFAYSFGKIQLFW